MEEEVVMRLKDKAIVITGGATGIGRASAVACAQEGAKLVIADVNVAEAKKTVAMVQKVGGQAHFVLTDVSVEAQVAKLMEEAERRLGRIDVLVTAAGVLKASLTPVDEVGEEAWDQVIDVNLKGSFLAAKHAVPAMRRVGMGVIIMIASGAGVHGPSSSVPYGASKGGVHGLAMTLAARLTDDNIRVIDICPGNINTPLKVGAIQQQVQRIGKAARAEEQMAELGDPQGVARIIAFLASDEADYLRGTLFTR
jgi:NAD(P)-dependent dehydrogenase (short-subunit alcohol dehydrogenase family)